MKTESVVIFLSVWVAAVSQAREPGATVWKKRELTKDFLTEGISAGDLDGDGATDLVAGAFWFKGPDFTEASNYRPGKALPVTVYQEDSFLSWIDDLNGDGRNDILMASRPGKEITVYLNPGKTGDWTDHRVMTEASTESPVWADLFGDGKKVLVCMQGGKFGYAKPDPADMTKPWEFVAISEKRTNSPYQHGLGTGDLNGDGRADIVEKDGWFEQPAAKDGAWVWHKEGFAGPGGAQMLVFDVDGDGDNDMVTSINGHGYGLAWYENRQVEGNVTFTKHEILPEDPAKKGVDGLQLSQLHSLASGDFDGDGRIDFVTGKRYFAHNGKDPGTHDPALTVIFHNRKDGDEIRWKAEVIDTDAGVGCQVLATDLNGSGSLAVVVGNKKGVTVINR